MKPWEETWRTSGRTLLCEPNSELSAYPDADFFGEEAEARIKLAACAPEMARMLDRLEWTANLGQNTYGCGICSAEAAQTVHYPARRIDAYTRAEARDVTTGGVHYPDCEMLALLRKAGVRE